MKNLLSVIGCSNLLLPDCCDTKQFPSFHSFEAQPHHQLYPCCPRANDTREAHCHVGPSTPGPRHPASQPTHPRVRARAPACSPASSLALALQAARRGAGRAGAHPRAAPARATRRWAPRALPHRRRVHGASGGPTWRAHGASGGVDLAGPTR